MPEQRHERIEPAVAATKEPDPLGIDVVVLREELDRGDPGLNVLVTHGAVDRRAHVTTVPGRAAVVEHEVGGAALRVVLRGEGAAVRIRRREGFVNSLRVAGAVN